MNFKDYDNKFKNDQYSRYMDEIEASIDVAKGTDQTYITLPLEDVKGLVEALEKCRKYCDEDISKWRDEAQRGFLVCANEIENITDKTLADFKKKYSKVIK